MEDKKTIISYFVILSFLVCALIGTSYGFIISSINSKPNVFVTGVLDISYIDGSESILLENSFPMTDEEGLDTKGYSFSITNTGNIPIYYLIYLEDNNLSDNSILRSQIKYSINGSSPKILPDYNGLDFLEQTNYDYSIFFGDLLVGEKKSFNLKIWINELETVSTVANKDFNSKVVVKSVNRPVWKQ